MFSVEALYKSMVRLALLTEFSRAKNPAELTPWFYCHLLLDNAQ